MVETFEKCFPLMAGFKAKAGENFNQRHTFSVSRINPPKFGGGLKLEPNVGIGKRGCFSKVSGLG
jgi:hypothetical protein